MQGSGFRALALGFTVQDVHAAAAWVINVSVQREKDIGIDVQICAHTPMTMYTYIYIWVEPIKIRTLRRTPACLLAFRRFQGLQWQMAFIFWSSPIFLGLLHTTHTHTKNSK